NSTLHQQPCATTARLAALQLFSHWIKPSPPVTAPGKAEIKYMDEQSTVGPKHHSSTYTSQMTHQTAAIHPLTHEEPFRESVSHGLCVFGYWQ
ncbi:hypothetical protein QQF64_007759, partial [Cirrhinus molitorella]